MGMNYYLKSKEKMIIQLPSFLNPHNQSESIKLHIGKESYGWKFLFCSLEQKVLFCDRIFQFTSIEDIKRELSTGHWVIVNENDEQISREDFWQIVNESLNDKKCHYTFCMEKYNDPMDSRLDIHGFTWLHREFC